MSGQGWEILQRFLAVMDERDVKEPDLDFPVVRYGETWILMIGPHTPDGFCWCLPIATDRRCPVPGHRHYIYDHADRVH